MIFDPQQFKELRKSFALITSFLKRISNGVRINDGSGNELGIDSIGRVSTVPNDYYRDVAMGDITIYKQGASSTIYNMIATGGNKSMVPHRMVPNAKTLYLKEWNASEGQGQRQSIRIRSTDMNGTLISGVFCFKGAVYLNKTTSPMMPLNVKIPALSIVKVSSWASVTGGEVTVNWWGFWSATNGDRGEADNLDIQGSLTWREAS